MTDEEIDIVVKESSRQMTECIRDGISIGMRMASETLGKAREMVVEENQTWPSAIAIINMARAEFDKKRSEGAL